LGCAIYVLSSEAAKKVVLLPHATYAELMPQVNEKLQLLNGRLGDLLRSNQEKKA
jgi:hypothetical protein